MITYTCEYCGSEMVSPQSMVGKTETCPSCGKSQTVPVGATKFPAEAEPFTIRGRSDGKKRISVNRGLHFLFVGGAGALLAATIALLLLFVPSSVEHWASPLASLLVLVCYPLAAFAVTVLLLRDIYLTQKEIILTEGFCVAERNWPEMAIRILATVVVGLLTAAMLTYWFTAWMTVDSSYDWTPRQILEPAFATSVTVILVPIVVATWLAPIVSSRKFLPLFLGASYAGASAVIIVLGVATTNVKAMVSEGARFYEVISNIDLADRPPLDATPEHRLAPPLLILDNQSPGNVLYVCRELKHVGLPLASDPTEVRTVVVILRQREYDWSSSDYDQWHFEIRVFAWPSGDLLGETNFYGHCPPPPPPMFQPIRTVPLYRSIRGPQPWTDVEQYLRKRLVEAPGRGTAVASRGTAVTNPNALFGARRMGGGTVGSFYGQALGKDVRHIVYVIDRSDSMVTMFDYLRVQILLSIGDLTEAQDFHIVLFGDEKTIEGPSNRLVPATNDNKVAVVEFLKN